MDDWPSKRTDQLPLEEAVLLAPVRPSKIVCVGRNYREHAAELGHDVPSEPLIFLKPPSSLLAPGANIVRPKISQRVDHEGELGVIIAKSCRHLGPDDDVRPYILGYTCVNDVTARDLQEKDGQWTRAKGFDTFCAVGPVVVSRLDPWAGVGGRDPSQRPGSAARHDPGFHLSAGGCRPPYRAGHDAASRGSDCYGNAQGRRAARRRR